MISGFITFIVWLVITAILAAFLGIKEKPPREHSIRNHCIFFLSSVSLMFLLMFIYINFWIGLMYFYGIVAIIAIFVYVFTGGDMRR